MQICTIIAKNYLAQARVLADSFLRHHPDGRIAVLVIDDFEGYIEPADVPFDVIGIDSIGLDARDHMAASYDVTEFSTAVKPWLLRHLLSQPGCDAITYLDPDILIVDDLEEVDRLALEHGLVLTPHFGAPLPRDGLKPSDEDILIAGAYNLGFISLREGADSERLLDWWAGHLLNNCIVDPDNGYFVDQRWIDLAPGLYPDLRLLRNPGYNLAYWNLPNRELRSEGGRYTVDGEPLRFFHFSGFDPLKPRQLSKHQNRIDVARAPDLAQICTEYSTAVLAAGYEEARSWPYGWDLLPGGLELDRYSRRLHREAVSESRMNGSVFNRKGAERLVSYLNEPYEAGAAEDGRRVTRYLGAIHQSREDLRIAFPDVTGRDAGRFLDWTRENTDSLGIPPELRPSYAVAPRTENGDAGIAHPVGTVGVNVAAYLSSELGVGEAGRQIASAISEVGIEASLIDIPVAAAEMPRKLALMKREEMPFDTNILCVNADMVPEFVAATDPRFFADRYSVGIWFWEVEQFPRAWHGSFGPLDEVWVATRHVAEAVRSESPIPVEVIRLPVAPVDPEKSDRAALGMPEGFCFLFVFDHRSVLKRKNPVDLIESFGRAFDAGSGVSLVIKSMGGEGHPEEVALLRELAAANPDVHLIEGRVTAEIKNAMIANCDCYVSLHRSEGFGLTMAEAMYFGKPVIATGYSGNLDFMTEENSYLVRHRMSRVGDDAGPYPADANWANPDIDDAARLMRHVNEHRDEAVAKGNRAAADIRRTHSKEASGMGIKARLQQIAERPSPAAPSTPIALTPTRQMNPSASPPIPAGGDPAGSDGMARLRHLLHFDEAPPRPGGGRLRRAAKRMYLRLLRPYVSYQRRINESTAQALDEVRIEMGRRHVAAEERNRVQLQQLQTGVAELQDALAAQVPGSAQKLGKAQRELEKEIGELRGTLAAEVSRTNLRIDASSKGLEVRTSELYAGLVTGLDSIREILTKELDARLEAPAAAPQKPRKSSHPAQ
ncbi:MAG: hypothetical protein QOK27_2800 [Gemmatimonadales bacterium]|jgi:glycosyltransferase involved in cell wall biosynthesis|nr:hypothetical protein [Gemmatimonadales bacterium]